MHLIIVTLFLNKQWEKKIKRQSEFQQIIIALHDVSSSGSNGRIYERGAGRVKEAEGATAVHLSGSDGTKAESHGAE